MATSGVVREEKQEQLTYSCYIIIKPSKWAMADSTILVQRSAKYSLREKVDRLYVSTGTISKHCKMCSTVINTEYKVENHIYEVPYNKQYLTYTRQCREVTKQCEVGSHSYEVLYNPQFYDYTNKLCRMVDEQILMAYCIRNKSKQRQYVARIQWLFDKTT